MDADQPQQKHVLNDGSFELVVNHGVAAIFHHYRLSGVALDVRQGLY